MLHYSSLTTMLWIGVTARNIYTQATMEAPPRPGAGPQPFPRQPLLRYRVPTRLQEPPAQTFSLGLHRLATGELGAQGHPIYVDGLEQGVEAGCWEGSIGVSGQGLGKVVGVPHAASSLPWAVVEPGPGFWGAKAPALCQRGASASSCRGASGQV